MKHWIAMAAGVWLAILSAVAQTNPTATATQPIRDGIIVTPDRPAATDSANVTAADLRPPRPERSDLPVAVMDRLDRFKLDARAYLLREQELKRLIQGANDRERAALREQLKELRERWSERAKDLRKEYKERQRELYDKLTEYRELLDDTRNAALQEMKERSRRGDD